MLTNILILLISILLIIEGAIYATKYAVKFAENFKISKFIVGLIIVAVISILPETLVSINSVLEGEPGLGLGTLFGPNVADLTLVFALIVLFSGRKSIKIEHKILKINKYFPFFLMLPIILGLDGHYGREEGIALILFGIGFYIISFERGVNNAPEVRPQGKTIPNLLFLLLSIGALLVGSHFAVVAGIDIANAIGVDPILIGILVIGLGTIAPELLFGLQAVKNHHDSLAVGDILGTVLADATIVVGIIAIMGPFYFPQKVVYITGIFMLIAAFLISYCMRTGKSLTRREGVFLLLFWLTYVLVEYFVNR